MIDTPNREMPDDDTRTLQRMGYAQELARCLGGFSNLAISMSIICILAGGITSLHVGFCGAGGASIGLGWPLVALYTLAVAATMAQVASAFPTAGGLYHWASILGGRSWGWFTAWFNLAGLVTVLAAINVGTYLFAVGAFFPGEKPGELVQLVVVLAMTASQAAVNHVGIRLTSRLTDLSGYLILAVASVLTVSLLVFAPTWEWSRLVTFANYGGLPEADPVLPAGPVWWLFLLGFLHPAYTITGFDASAHAAEETVDAAHQVPRGIVGSVLISGVAGWIMLVAIVLAIPDMDEGARQGGDLFYWLIRRVLPAPLGYGLFAGIVIAQYLCGLATVTSTSRMAYAFARDGGMPFSFVLRRVSPTHRTPAVAIWTVALASVLFTIYTPVYTTIAAVCTLLLYVSYAIPTALGFMAHGRSWTRFGPWRLGRWYRPLAVVSVLGGAGLIVIGMQPPNEKAAYVLPGFTVILLGMWFAGVRRYFAGPPHAIMRVDNEVSR
jgi:amino acid transporter